MNVEGLTDSKGQCEYVIDGPGHFILSVSRDGYVSYTKEFCLSKTSLFEIYVPVIPVVEEVNDKAAIRIYLSGDCGSQELSFNIYSPNSILYSKYLFK